jgi:transposase InsO family protein
MVRHYVSLGLSTDRCLEIVDLTKNQYYYKSKGTKPGKRASTVTLRKEQASANIIEVPNEKVVQRIVEIKLDSDHANYYRLITKTLNLEGYYINHKKVYRLMYDLVLLEQKSRTTGKKYVKYRRVAPSSPLEVMEMDIKYIWVVGMRKYAFVLTVIDTFTRYVLHWAVGYKMRSRQVVHLWEYIVANYIQPIKGGNSAMEIEVRNDNGKQFSSKETVQFFKENNLNQVFTHPYTPQENGHIESFHKTLGQALKNDKYNNLQELEDRLKRFYTVYNNSRSHGSIKGLPPSIFWSLVDKDLIEIRINKEKRRVKYELKVAYQDIMSIDEIQSHQYQVI